VVAAIVWQAIRFNFSDTPAGPTSMNWLTTIAIMLVENLSIITACVPYLKPFLESLESGLIRNDDLRRRGEITGAGGFATYGSGKRSQLSMKDSEAPAQDTTAVELTQIGKDPSARTVASVIVGARISGDSQGSRVKMITQTKTWVVDDTATEKSSQNP
jgi:hypothetical protein